MYYLVVGYFFLLSEANLGMKGKEKASSFSYLLLSNDMQFFLKEI